MAFLAFLEGRLRIMQNTLQLVDALTDRNVPFELSFARSKSAYDHRERVRFYYQYLLEKPVPKEFD